MAVPIVGDSGIPRGSMKLRQRRSLRELPGERMLASTRPHEEDSHRIECTDAFGVCGISRRRAAMSDKCAVVYFDEYIFRLIGALYRLD